MANRRTQTCNGARGRSAFTPIQSFAIEALESRRLLAVDLALDLNPATLSSSPEQFVESGGYAYFVADHPEYGWELFRSDGTSDGTDVVADLRPGATGAIEKWSGDADEARLTPFRNGILFTADDGARGKEAWFTDGTSEGTVSLGDLNPTGDAHPHFLPPIGERAVFRAKYNSGSYGWALYGTDGTANGTHKLLEYTSISETVSFGGYTYLVIAQTQLWRTDGTPGGTERVLDLQGEIGINGASDLFVVGGRLYFSGGTDESGYELWTTDGTAAGTQQITDLVSGVANGFVPTSLLSLGSDRVLYVQSETLWVTDGTEAGTQPIDELIPDFREAVVTSDGTAYFRAEVPDARTDWALWRSDGTVAGTQKVVDLDPDRSTFPSHLTLLADNRLAFIARSVEEGIEVFTSDGTAEGTRQLSSSAPGPARGVWEGLGTIGGALLFAGIDALHGTELWLGDPQAHTTELLSDLNRDGASSSPVRMHATPEGMWFFTIPPPGTHGVLHYRSNATGDLQVFEAPFHPMVSFSRLVPQVNIGERLIFQAGDGFYAADPSTGVVEWLGERDYYVPLMARMGDQVLFHGQTEEGAAALWATDGTAAGTRLVLQAQVDAIIPGATQALISTNDARAWFAFDPHTGEIRQVLTGDGITRGAEIEGAALGDIFLFGAAGQGLGRELWRSDGTPEGTRLLVDLRPGEFGADPADFRTVGGQVFLTAYDPSSNNRQLWVTDGTAEGTRKLGHVDGGIGHTSSIPNRLFGEIDGNLLFQAKGIWRSDGTEAGTFPIGPESYNWTAAHPVALETSRILFVNYDGGSWAIYATDGTAAGTVPLFSEKQSWVHPVLSDGAIAFQWTRPETGAELYQLSLPPNGPLGSVGAHFEFEAEQQLVTEWDRELAPLILTEQWRIRSLDSGQLLDPAQFAVAVEGARAVVRFADPIPDGNWRLEIPRTSTYDVVGQQLAEDVALDFFVLAGDANRDRKVDFSDFLILRSNFGRTDDPLFSQGDFNYDGKCDFADFLILRSKFGVNLPPPSSGSLFSGGEDGEEGDGTGSMLA